MQTEFRTAVSNKAKTDKKKEKKIAVVDKIQAPKTPIKRPKQIHVTKLKKGKIKIQKYIKLYLKICYFADLSNKKGINLLLNY